MPGKVMKMAGKNPDAKVCPWCGETIKKQAIICRFCFQDVTPKGVLDAQRFKEEPGKKKPPQAPTKDASLSRLSRFVPKTLMEELLYSVETIEEGERRPIAVVFCDLSGFTSLTEELGAEQMSDLLDEIYESTRKVIARYDGVVEKFIGDAVMAIFGAPAAHGDDPERAIRSALDIRTAVQSIGKKHLFDLDTHSGVAFGEVVFKTTAGEGRLDFRSIGDAVNLACRLQGRAETGETLADHRIYLQTRTVFDWETLSPMKIKGKKELVRVHKVSGIRKQFAKVILGERIEMTPLVGRKKELGLLTRKAEKTAQGKGGIVVVKGEAGVGKSRLIYELYQLIKAKDFNWFTGRALSFGTHIPFLLFVSLVRAILGYPREGGASITPDILRGRLKGIFTKPSGFPGSKKKISKSMQDEIFFALCILLSMDVPENPFLLISSKNRRARIFKAVGSLIRFLSEQKPTILIFEDLHWGDADSVELLDYLIPCLTDASVMFVFVVRPDFVHRFPGEEDFLEISLGELSRAQSRKLLSQIMGSSRIPPGLRDLLLQKTEGNPFYLEEVILNLEEQGSLRKKGKTYQLACPVKTLAIPDTVEGVVLSRLDRLERKIKGVLQCASVIGQEFRYQTLAQITEINRELQNHLVSLVQGDYILEQTLIPELIYIFRHIVLRDVTYSTLLEKRRRFFHARVAKAMEELFSGHIDEHVEFIAHHFRRGAVFDKAAVYLEKAALKSESLFSQRSAFHFWQDMIQCTDKAGFSEKEKKTLRLKGLLHLGELCRRLGKPSTGVDIFYMALKDAEDLDDIPGMINSLRGLGESYRLKGDIEKATESLERGIHIARMTKQTALLISCYNVLGNLERTRGNFKKAKIAFEQVFKFSQNTGNREKQYQALNHLGILYMYEGTPEKAGNCFSQALEIAEELGRKNEQVQIGLNLALIDLRCGNPENAEKRLLSVLSRAEKLQFERGVQLAMLALSDLYLKTGDFPRSLSVCRRLQNRMKEAVFSDVIAMALSNCARAYLSLGKKKPARQCMLNALSAAEMDENYAAIVDALEVKTEVQLAENDFARALKTAQQMLSLVNTRGKGEFLSQAQRNIARVYLAMKDPSRGMDWAQKALQNAKKSCMKREEAWALYIIAALEILEKKPGAKKHLSNARAIADRIRDEVLINLIKNQDKT